MKFIFIILISSSCNFFKTVTGEKPHIPKDFVPSSNEGTNLIIDREAPFQILRVIPTPESSYNTELTVQIYGVENGDNVVIYSDSNCSNQINSAQATSDVIEFSLNNLSYGTHYIYARIINSESASPCSTAFATYTRLTCPANYIHVPYDLIAGTNMDFCVAKFEMKNVSSVPTSQPSGLPWVSITQTNAITSCESLGSNYTLMTNLHWMTIARNIDAQDNNWSTGMSGSGVLFRGHSDGSPATLLSISDAGDFYNGTGNTMGSGTEQKRVHILSNNEEIWDFSGNASEWINWTVNPNNKAYRSTDGAPTTSFIEFNSLDTNINFGDDMATFNWEPFNSTLGGVHGLGTYYAGTAGTGGAAIRGGSYTMGINAGVYSLNISLSSASSNGTTGFRCVNVISP